MELQAKETKKEPTTQLKIGSYECTVCTLINPEGKAICEACGSPAPQSAYILTKSEEEIKREKEAEELKKREEEEKIK